MSPWWIYGIGLVAQLLFASRLLIQWIKSEKAGQVVSPGIFWQLSLIASFLLIAYGMLRNDPVIILGQVISYFIYIRNLSFGNAWKQLPILFRTLVVAFPLAAILWLMSDNPHNWRDLTTNSEISGFLMVWGTIGQVVFMFRFVYQWYYSELEKKSLLPAGFWIISVIGSLMIITYGIFRNDPVIILGQVFGFVIYARNLWLLSKAPRMVHES